MEKLIQVSEAALANRLSIEIGWAILRSMAQYFAMRQRSSLDFSLGAEILQCIMIMNSSGPRVSWIVNTGYFFTGSASTLGRIRKAPKGIIALSLMDEKKAARANGPLSNDCVFPKNVEGE